MDATFFPSTDAELLAWSWALARRASTDAASLGVNARVAGAFVATQARFAAAVASVKRSPTSRVARAEADGARESMRRVARPFAACGGSSRSIRVAA